MARSVVVGIDRRQLEIASEEVSWLALPDDDKPGGGGGGGDGDYPTVLQVCEKKTDSSTAKKKPNYQPKL